MSDLRAIVAALGGDLYHNGQRASVPAPGHSREDRSVSLLLSEGRVIAHGFGAADWRAALDDLRRRNLVDAQGRPASSGLGGGLPAASSPRPDRRLRLATAQGLWDGAFAPGPTGLVVRHLHRRGVAYGPGLVELREHGCAPTSVYRSGSRGRPAMLARILDSQGQIAGVEMTYLQPNGAPAQDLRISRKTVGMVPAGAAVRLMPAAERMLVGEGVLTVLSAIRRFGLPGWALLAAGNLAQWTPPAWVRYILVAADPGAVGETAADRLAARLQALGITASIALPPAPSSDWNDAAMAAAGLRRREEGRGRAPDRRG